MSTAPRVPSKGAKAPKDPQRRVPPRRRKLKPGPVLVLGSRDKRTVREAVDRTCARLERDFGIAAVDLDHEIDPSAVKASWAIVFGGDGAILSASRRMGEKPIPVLAVNFGRLGFLTEVEYSNLDDALDRILEGKAHVRERMRLTAQVGEWRHTALNDVVVQGAMGGRLFRVAATIQGREALRYAGDGIVIATPTGSTAYSLAAGGPILDPELEATVITPLAAHALAQRPLVIPSYEKIELYLRERDPPGRVVVDGQVQCSFHGKDRVTVQRADTPFLLVRVGDKSYYSRLRRILGWGGQPKYAE